MTGVLTRRDEGTLTLKEGAPTTVEAEIGVMRPQTKEHHGFSGAASSVKGKEGFSPRKDYSSADPLILDPEGLELSENTFLVFLG